MDEMSNEELLKRAQDALLLEQKANGPDENMLAIEAVKANGLYSIAASLLVIAREMNGKTEEKPVDESDVDDFINLWTAQLEPYWDRSQSVYVMRAGDHEWAMKKDEVMIFCRKIRATLLAKRGND